MAEPGKDRDPAPSNPWTAAYNTPWTPGNEASSTPT